MRLNNIFFQRYETITYSCPCVAHICKNSYLLETYLAILHDTAAQRLRLKARSHRPEQPGCFRTANTNRAPLRQYTFWLSSAILYISSFIILYYFYLYCYFYFVFFFSIIYIFFKFFTFNMSTSPQYTSSPPVTFFTTHIQNVLTHAALRSCLLVIFGVFPCLHG